jgi:hypothetical protein
MIWYLAKISFIQQDDKGHNRVVTQDYLFDAVSYTDAETRAYAYCAQELQEFKVSSITKQKYNEIFHWDDKAAEAYWKVKTNYIVFDEKAQREKKVPFLFLVCAESLMDAHELTILKLGKVQDYRIESITSTSLLDIIEADTILAIPPDSEEASSPEE